MKEDSKKISYKDFFEWLKDYISDDEAKIFFKRWNLGSFDFKQYLLEKMEEVEEDITL